MKNSLFAIAVVLLFSQLSFADVIESCQLSSSQVVAEDGRNDGIQIALVYENGNLLSVSDDLRVTHQNGGDMNAILANTQLSSLVNSLHLVLENVSAVQKLEIAKDAVVIRFMDDAGTVLAKVGQIGQQTGVCQPEK